MEIEDPKEFRTNIQNKFLKLLENKKLAKNLEIGIFNSSIQDSKKRKITCKWSNKYFLQIYISKLKTIITNFKRNLKLLEKIKKGTILPQEIAFMSHQEMCPEIWKELIDAKIKRGEAMCEDNMEAATDEFKCYKCKNRKCTYYQLQTRSADEPMTTFVTCLICGTSWKC